MLVLLRRSAGKLLPFADREPSVAGVHHVNHHLCYFVLIDDKYTNILFISVARI